MPTFAAVLLFFTCFHSAVAYRRILHQPLFSGDSLPPIYSPPPPDYPFTTSDSQPDNTPLFPSDPSALPPPIPATFASFPANASSVTLPRSPAEKSPYSKLIVAAVAAVVAAVVVVSVAVFLQVRRRRGGDRLPSVEQVKTQRSDGNSPHRPPDRLPVPKLERPSQTSSEFLYLGTLVNSQGGGGGFAFTGGNGAMNDDSHARSMESPELQPLPPLTTRQSARRNYRSNVDAATGKDDEDDEFYSPKGSVNGAESNIGSGSSSRRTFSGVRAENFNGSTSNSSYIYSTTTASGSGSGSPERSGSLSLSPRRNPSPGSSIPKSPELIEIQNIAPMHRQIPRAQATAFQESGSPSPHSSSSPGGYSRQSGESSPRISTSSDTILDPPQLSNPTLPENPPFLHQGRELPLRSPFYRHRHPTPTPTPTPPPFKVTEFLHDKMPALNRNAVESSLSVEISSNGRGAVENNFKNESPVKEIELPSEATDTDDQLFSKPKLKPLHWDKVRASSDRKMVWDQLKCSSFKLNEEMIETLFVANTPNLTPKKPPRWQVIPSPGRESGNSVLDPKKAQNIAILLKALNVTLEEVSEGLMEGNVEALGTELLEGLLKMAPTKEEERKLKEYNDASSPSNLGAAERFLKAIIDTPYAFKRAEAMIYASNFESEVEYLRKSYSILEAACEELRTSRMFLKILEAVLKTGNRMNVGTNRGDAHAFKLDTLLKLVDVKGADGKTTLLHFVVQEIIRTEGARLSDRTLSENLTVNDDAKCKKLGLQVVSSLGSELSNVKKAATMDSEVLSGDLFKLSQGLGSIHEVARLISASPSNGSNSHKFCDSMNNFMKKAGEDIIRIQAQESVALSLVKEITEYFHGNSAKEEAHPFRIFVVVRDFLSILDRVCKEVGMANERTTILSPASKFPVPVNPMLQQQVPFGFRARSRAFLLKMSLLDLDQLSFRKRAERFLSI